MLSGMRPEDFWPALPALVPALYGLLLLVAVPWFKNDRRFLWTFSVIGMAVSTIVPAWMLHRIGDTGSFSESLGSPDQLMVRADLLALWLDVIFATAGFFALLMVPHYLERMRSHHGEVYPLTFFAVSGMALMAGTQNLVMVFIGLEVLSISLYVLCGLARENAQSLEAALKYFLLGAFSTGFLVYGLALVLGATGQFDLKGIAAVIRGGVDAGLNLPLLLAGLALLIVAFGFKIALVPFHFWLPDVYQGAPTPITAFMAAGTKAAALGVFLRVLHIGFGAGGSDDPIAGRWIAALSVLAALTMILGNLVALVQVRVKRLLAYSSVAHAGYLLLALIAPLEIGVGNLVFYLVSYTFMTMGAFAVVSLFQDDGEDADHVDNFRGLWHRRPLLALSMMVFLLSMTGIPPTGGFTGKYLIFVTALESGHWILATIMGLSAVIGAAYYLRVIVAMFLESPQGAVAEELQIPAGVALVVGLSTAATILLGLVPSLLTEPLSLIHTSLS